jgi:hypothetical protein
MPTIISDGINHALIRKRFGKTSHSRWVGRSS